MPVLHIAFLPSLSIAEVGEALRSAGARGVEGPDDIGIVGVAPVTASADVAGTTAELRAIAARLRGDARVRWVQPLPGTLAGSAAAEPPQHGPPQP